jgi:hypothetical protein
MDIRLPMPAAYGDPAFGVCLHEAIATDELVTQFDRLYGATLRSKATQEDMGKFVAFVHDSIYLRLPADAIHALRATAMQGA